MNNKEQSQIEVIEHLDFDIACTYRDRMRQVVKLNEACPNSAVWIVTLTNPLTCGCVTSGPMFMCNPCWEYRNHTGVTRCRKCGERKPCMAEILSVERIKP